MARPEKIGAISRNMTLPVQAVQLYATTNQHIAMNSSSDGNTFRGCTSMGLFQWNYGEGGQLDPTQYPDNGEAFHQTTICWA